MAIRSIPKQDVLDCFPGAAEIGNLRVANRDLDFVQRMIDRADDLALQAQNATEYSQIVKVADNFMVLAERAEIKSGTLHEFSKQNLPSEVVHSDQLLVSVENLRQAIEVQVNNLTPQFQDSVSSHYEQYSSTISSLHNQIDGISTHSDVTAIFGSLKDLLSSIGKNVEMLNSDERANTLLGQLESLSSAYKNKAEKFNDAFEVAARSRISDLEVQISALSDNISSLSSAESVQLHVDAVDAIHKTIASEASGLNSVSDSKELIQNLNELSIATHREVVDMVESNSVIEGLIPYLNNSEQLVVAVKEASIRVHTKLVDDTLMPLINNTSALADKVGEVASQYQLALYSDISEKYVANIDKVIGRIEIKYKMLKSNEPERLANEIHNSVATLTSDFDSLNSVDPSSMSNSLVAYVEQVGDAINASDVGLFLNTAQSISRDVMMNSRLCVDNAFRDFTREFGGFIETVFDPLLVFLDVFESIMLATPWPLFLLVVGALAWAGSRSVKVSVSSMLAIFVIGLFDMWAPMMSTVALVTAATTLCLAVGIPMGIWMSKSNRAQSVITPVLDIMQTIPSFVYLIPVVMLLGIGKVPGLIAVCIYAMPPIVRLTNLGIRLVDKEAMEAADAFGASYKQRLFTVQIPLALPNIFAGVNQTIMMALAMVVIASMIGVAGLGLPVLQAVQNQYLSLGMLNGLAIVALAIVFDRVSQAFGTRIQKHRSGDVL